MAGLGEHLKLSIQQQESTIGDLVPALVAGERIIDELTSDAANAEIVELHSALARCLSEIRELISDVEEGHSRMSSLDPDDLNLMVEFLVKEVKQIGSRLRTALSHSRTKRR